MVVIREKGGAASAHISPCANFLTQRGVGGEDHSLHYFGPHHHFWGPKQAKCLDMIWQDSLQLTPAL